VCAVVAVRLSYLVLNETELNPNGWKTSPSWWTIRPNGLFHILCGLPAFLFYCPSWFNILFHHFHMLLYSEVQSLIRNSSPVSPLQCWHLLPVSVFCYCQNVDPSESNCLATGEMQVLHCTVPCFIVDSEVLSDDVLLWSWWQPVSCLIQLFYKGMNEEFLSFFHWIYFLNACLCLEYEVVCVQKECIYAGCKLMHFS
jgi:hypothetical protein